MLKHLNKQDENVQFTVEHEANNTLPYLDMRLIREAQTITFDWYRKDTAPDRTLDYTSQHPHRTKMNVACNMIRRVLQLSDTQFHHKNMKHVNKILIKNHYPRKLVDRLLSKARPQEWSKIRDPPSNVEPPEQDDCKYIANLYIPGYSEKLQKHSKLFPTMSS